jgi:hypothetical protein
MLALCIAVNSKALGLSPDNTPIGLAMHQMAVNILNGHKNTQTLLEGLG